MSIINRDGEVALRYSKVFVCDFGEEELRKPEPDPREIGCDWNGSPADSFDVCALSGRGRGDGGRDETRAFDNLAAVAMANYPVPRNNGSRAYTCVPWSAGGRAAGDTM